jgi:hypothetical protein
MIDKSNFIFTQVKNSLGTSVKDASQTFQDTPSQLPAIFMNTIGNDQASDDFENNENAVNNTIEFTAYAVGTSKLTTCKNILSKVDTTMRKFGYRRIYGPRQITNISDTTICRMVSRYNRIIGSDDILK